MTHSIQLSLRFKIEGMSRYRLIGRDLEVEIMKEEAALIVAISQYVADHQGCKATELCCVPELVSLATKASRSLLIVLNEMVDNGDLVEIEYTVPNLDFRIKSFLLPKGSRILNTGDFEQGTGDD